MVNIMMSFMYHFVIIWYCAVVYGRSALSVYLMVNKKSGFSLFHLVCDSLSDEAPATCEAFVAESGMQVYVDLLEVSHHQN